MFDPLQHGRLALLHLRRTSEGPLGVDLYVCGRPRALMRCRSVLKETVRPLQSVRTQQKVNGQRPHLFQASQSSLKVFNLACSSGFHPFAIRWKALQRFLRAGMERRPLQGRERESISGGTTDGGEQEC